MSGIVSSPGTDMIIRGLALAAGALLVLNFYGVGGASGLLSLNNVMPAAVIGLLSLLIEVYLPKAEYYVESQF